MINYNDLYEILRKEKYGEALQQLPRGFVEDMAAFLNERKEETNKEDGMFLDNVVKSKKQLENSISIFKELIRLRKKKLLSLVFIAAETGIMKRDFENMLVFERDLFEKLVKAFEEGDKDLAKTMSGKKTEEKNRMIMFSQNVEQFMGMDGNPLGPYNLGELVNMDAKVAEIFVSGGKANYVENE